MPFQRLALSAAILTSAAAGVLALQPPTAVPPAQPAAEPQTQASPDVTAAMDPGRRHLLLSRLVGDWEIAYSMEIPGQPPLSSTGSATFSHALGGRFLHESGRGEMRGVPAEHFKVWGFNNGSGKYEAVWTWTLQTSMLTLVGTPSDDGRRIDWTATFDDELGGRQQFKVVMTFTDDDHFTLAMSLGGEGGPSLRMSYSRLKPGVTRPAPAPPAAPVVNPR